MPRDGVTYTSIQKQALEYNDIASAVYPLLKPFYHGNIPMFEHYKRFTMDPMQALKVASYAYLQCLQLLNVKLYFTQAVIVGAALLGTHRKIYSLTPSQYGKSFLAACVSCVLAYEGEPISVAANDKELTKKIMDEVRSLIPNASEEFKEKLTTPIDKFEKMNTSLSKDKIGFTSGGYVQGLTLGGKFSDSLSGNKAVGQSGNFIIDESALVPDGNYAETGRSEVAYRKDGRPYVSMEFSNPHQINHFYRDMTQDPIETGSLIIWADIRISMEEGKQLFYSIDKSKPKIEETKFFKNEQVCRSYYLSEFGNLTDGSFFPVEPTIDNSPVDLNTGRYVLGLDSANRGADAIMGCVMKLPDADTQVLRGVSLINFKPTNWVDRETPGKIAETVIALVEKIGIEAIVMDLGGGEYLYERLIELIDEKGLACSVKGVYFNNSTTKERVRKGFDFSDGTANGAELGINKRAEMYLDFRDMIEKNTISFSQEMTDQLRDEMTATGKETYTNSGKIQLEDKVRYIKKRLGHSPDSLDATVLAVHAFALNTLGLIDRYNISLY